MHGQVRAWSFWEIYVSFHLALISTRSRLRWLLLQLACMVSSQMPARWRLISMVLAPLWVRLGSPGPDLQPDLGADGQPFLRNVHERGSLLKDGLPTHRLERNSKASGSPPPWTGTGDRCSPSLSQAATRRRSRPASHAPNGSHQDSTAWTIRRTGPDLEGVDGRGEARLFSLPNSVAAPIRL